LENDGRALAPSRSPFIAGAGYAGSTDRQNFIAIGEQAPSIREEAPLRSTFDDLRPLRVVATGSENRTFVYPSAVGDPAAEDVRRSFATTPDGFRSVLGKVSDRLYVGRTSAGGVGKQLDLDADGKPDVRFGSECGFLLQLDRGRVTAVESDRAVSAEIQGRRVGLTKYTPVLLAGVR
jgi:hypothetical protein